MRIRKVNSVDVKLHDFSGRLTAVTDMGQCIRKSGRKEDWRKHHKYLWL